MRLEFEKRTNREIINMLTGIPKLVSEITDFSRIYQPGMEATNNDVYAIMQLGRCMATADNYVFKVDASDKAYMETIAGILHYKAANGYLPACIIIDGTEEKNRLDVALEAIEDIAHQATYFHEIRCDNCSYPIVIVAFYNDATAEKISPDLWVNFLKKQEEARKKALDEAKAKRLQQHEQAMQQRQQLYQYQPSYYSPIGASPVIPSEWNVFRNDIA